MTLSKKKRHERNNSPGAFQFLKKFSFQYILCQQAISSYTDAFLRFLYTYSADVNILDEFICVLEF